MSTTTTQVEQQHATELEVDTRPETQPRSLEKITYFRLISVGFAFFVAGVNDGSIGALVPHIMRDYGLDTAIVSSVYAANLFGWFVAALTNTHLTQMLGLGSMLLLGASAQVVGHVLRAWRPPFPLFVVTFGLASLGQAYQDTCGNTFVASLKGAAHRWLAFIHAMYMAGCLVAPFVATAVASAETPSRWWLFYLFPLGLGVGNVVVSFLAFRGIMSIKKSRVRNTDDIDLASTGEMDGRADTATQSPNDGPLQMIKETLANRDVWIISIFFFFFLGATLTASGWVVEYLVVVRDGRLSQMGYVPAGFSGGSLLGRLLLAEPTHRFGPRRMIFIYTILSIALQLLFWLVPNIIAASIAVSLLGFFMGPYFATGISIGAQLFPPRIHSTALAFVFVFAQIGGCVFPIVTGLIALKAGVAVLQPVLCGLLAATAVSWLLVPKPKESGNPALHNE